MPQGPAGFSRPFATSTVKAFIPLNRPFNSPTEEIEHDFELMHDIQVDIEAGILDSMDEILKAISEGTIGDKSHFVSIEFKKTDVEFQALKLLTDDMLRRTPTITDRDVFIQTTDPKGLLRTPRPLASSNISIRLSLDISNSHDLSKLGTTSRRNKIETALRVRTDERLDVNIGPNHTFILTRRPAIRYSELKNIVNQATLYLEDKGARITDVSIIANGE